MRLFIAIELPDSIKNYLRSIQDVLPDAKMSKTGDFHLTLKFLGETSEAQLERLDKALFKIPFKSFDACLSSIGTFGKNRSPRVVWVGLQVPDWLLECARQIEDSVEEIGFPAERRFVPHITLARVKFVSDGEVFIRELAKIKIEPLKFKVDGFHVFESKLASKGAVYSKIKTYLAKSDA